MLQWLNRPLFEKKKKPARGKARSAAQENAPIVMPSHDSVEGPQGHSAALLQDGKGASVADRAPAPGQAVAAAAQEKEMAGPKLLERPPAFDVSAAERRGLRGSPAFGQEHRGSEILDRKAPLSGEVELHLAATVELKLMSGLFECLQTTLDLRILSTRGFWDGSATIVVLLENPLPLIEIIASKMAGVVVTAELMDSGRPSKLSNPAAQRFGEAKETTRIWLELKAPVSG